ncbi:GNVR domain-containing protein [Sphingomonas limnosediminicola]|uniref:GNVR domain-containing protein n=1 Tax=Sphingomonas limnosediminicola TaxID=940133 RepID=A0ABP7L2W4_9SPHN
MIESHNFEQTSAGFGWVINHLPHIMWERRYYAVGVFIAFFAVALIAAFMLPTQYRSTATLLIESQQLSTTVAQSPETGAIEQRISKIREKVLSRGDLIALIEQYDLYSSERRSQPLSKIIDKMRTATSVGALQQDIGTANPNQSNVIAINMSFDYPDPIKAQEVLQSYVASFLRMDSDVVEDQATLNVRFLEDQAGRLQGQIQQIEGQIRDLKARNGSVLAPGAAPSMLDTGSYSAQIVQLENENRQLIIQSKRPAARDQQLAQAEAALAAARATYSDSHPDVIAARQRLNAVRDAIQGPGDSGDQGALQAQIQANNQAIAQLRGERQVQIARATASAAGQARGPAILEQASQLEDRVSQLRTQYKQVSDDLLKAQTGARMTGEQRGEHLSLVEPASLPDRPYSPNRPLLIAAGAAAGAALGLLLALIVEMLRRPVRSPAQIEGLGFPILGIVPVVGRPDPKRRTWWLFKRRETGIA